MQGYATIMRVRSAHIIFWVLGTGIYSAPLQAADITLLGGFSNSGASLSPDALTGMEASLRFNGETMATRIFGRLSAWQNWIFNRPNAVGEHGALKAFGTGKKVQFNRDRV